MLNEKGEVADVVFSGVTKRYGKAPPVLDQIDLTVAKGEFVGIIGPSGCGKSTLLKIVSGLTPISAGQVYIDGMSPSNAREIVSYVFQDPTLVPWLTVSRNIGLGLELEGVSRQRREEKITSLLSLVNLDHVASAYPRQLSGGMKMRVSIARALATRPRILLMDEPFAALDEMTRDRMNEELLRLRSEHDWTVLFVTHSVAEAVFLSTRIVVLAPYPGRIAHDIANPLPSPRTADTRDSSDFEELVTSVSKTLRGVTLA